MSEQQAEQTSCEPTSVGAGTTVPTSSDALIEKVMASVREVQTIDAPAVAPDREAPNAEASKAEASKADALRMDTPKMDAPKIEALKMETPKMEAPRMEAPKVTAPAADGMHPTGKLLIMSRRDRPAAEEAGAANAAPPKRRLAAMVDRKSVV